MNDTDTALPPARTRVWVPLVLALGALVLYFITLCRGAFPGLPAKSLAWHMWLDAVPMLLDSLWGRLVRLCAAGAGAALPQWMGALSAVFGAACVALLAALMMRVRHSVHDAHDPDEMRRETQACALGGLTAGLYAMASVPFWVLSTRSLPGTFHLLLLLGAVWLFAEYQRTGKTAFLYLLGLLYGVGIAEFATFWVFAPLAAVLVVRAMLQRAEFSVRVLVRTGLCVLPGLLLYVWNGWTLWADPAVRLRGFASMWAVIWYIWRDQWHLIVNAPQTTGFLMVMALTILPWGMLFLLRAKKPAWRYSAWQTALRLAVLLLAMGVVFNAPFAPWRFFGMYYLMATPYLILAACAGYVAGELWVMGQVREHRNAGIGQPLRSLMGVVGLLAPVAVVAAGYWNWPVANGRPGESVAALADGVLADLAGRDVLLSDGILDDGISLRARARGLDLTVVALPQTPSDLYRRYLAQRFPGSRQQSLLQVGFGAFLQDFLAQDEGLARTASLDVTDPLREFGYLVPDGLIYRAEPSGDRVDLAPLLEKQRPFWNRMEQWAARAIDERNPAAFYQRQALRLASKAANNVGFMQVERGDALGAVETFKQARRIDADNVSALLNLLTLAQERQLPELPEYEAAWTAFKERHVDTRVMWALSGLYGYVHNTGFLVRHGMIWAVSGKPRMAEAELRRAAGTQAVDPAVKAFLGRAYLSSGDLRRGAEFYRDVLKEKPNDPEALTMLAELAIGNENYAVAEQLLGQAEAAGVPPARLRFERIVLQYLQGQIEPAVAALKELAKQSTDDSRVWAWLAMLTGDGRDPATYDKALKSLKNLQGSSPEVRLMLAELYQNRQQWPEARNELEQVLRMNPRQVRALEMLVDVDFQERKRELAEDHVRILLTLDPDNFTGNLMLGSFQYARGQYSLAESSYRTALQKRRDPTALNDLAYLLMLKEGGRPEARTLVEEALAAQPANPVFLSTRAELNLLDGRYDEAERDLQLVLAAMPDNAQSLLLSARLYAARGQAAAARDVAGPLSDRLGELPAEQQVQLQDLLKNTP